MSNTLSRVKITSTHMHKYKPSMNNIEGFIFEWESLSYIKLVKLNIRR